MKIKCNNCGKVSSKSKKLLWYNVRRLGIGKDDYLKIYLCRKCRTKLTGSGNLDWDNISQIPNLSEQFIEKYKDYINWDDISRYQKLSEKLIGKYKVYVHWDYISQYQKLSEKFIEKYKDYVDWYNISQYQKLSEQFIEKYKRYVVWDYVSRYQNLSPEFVQKHMDKITSSILNNPCYKSYLDSLKLLLKVKFDRR